jgi:hypothetical protein
MLSSQTSNKTPSAFHCCARDANTCDVRMLQFSRIEERKQSQKKKKQKKKNTRHENHPDDFFESLLLDTHIFNGIQLRESIGEALLDLL